MYFNFHLNEHETNIKEIRILKIRSKQDKWKDRKNRFWLNVIELLNKPTLERPYFFFIFKPISVLVFHFVNMLNHMTHVYSKYALYFNESVITVNNSLYASESL